MTLGTFSLLVLHCWSFNVRVYTTIEGTDCDPSGEETDIGFFKYFKSGFLLDR